MLKEGDMLKCMPPTKGVPVLSNFTIGENYKIYEVSYESDRIIISDSNGANTYFTITPSIIGLSWKTFFSLREVKLTQLLGD